MRWGRKATLKEAGGATVEESIMRTVKLLLILSLLAAGLAGMCWVKAANAYTLDIKAVIDGYDQLIIQNNTLQWQHFEHTAVGYHALSPDLVYAYPPFPTIITTAAMGTVNWSPTWSFDPYTSEGYGQYSSVYTGLNPALAAVAQTVTLNPVSWRDSVTIVQQPSAGNSYTFKVELNDNNSAGAVWYEFQLTYQTVPPVPLPGTLLLLGSGLVGLAVRGRRKRV